MDSLALVEALCEAKTYLQIHWHLSMRFVIAEVHRCACRSTLGADVPLTLALVDALAMRLCLLIRWHSVGTFVKQMYLRILRHQLKHFVTQMYADPDALAHFAICVSLGFACTVDALCEAEVACGPHLHLLEMQMYLLILTRLLKRFMMQKYLLICLHSLKHFCDALVLADSDALVEAH